MSKNLFDGSSESEVEVELSTNKDYAKSYNNFRKKELLKKFKDRGYDLSESESSDSDSTDSEEVADPQFDEEFFKTLASLKSKDPKIYDKNTKFFEKDVDVVKSKEKSDKQKPLTLKDYERKIILENDGKFEASDASDVEDIRSHSPTIVEEERKLKEEFKKALDDNDSDEEEFGGIFKKRQKTKQEQDKEDADFIEWLAGKKDNIQQEVKEKLAPLKKYWDNEKLPQREKFLRDYILNKGYANTTFAEIPTYEEIIGDVAPLSEDEEELEKQAEFEHKYNFRFEEPDTEFIKRYPRTIENSIRQKDDKRKQKREEIKDRKLKEKEQKLKELELVKEMKRKEIEEKIRKLKLVTGNDELGFKDDELEEDFDPDAHDRRMQEIFNDEYYEVNEGEEKPECPSDIEELKYENWDNYDPNNDGDNYSDNEPHCEDTDFNMDCDYDPNTAKEQLQKDLIESTKGRRKRKGRKNRFAEILKQDKPVFKPEDEKTYGEYIDEYYKIDCEDFIGDLPCRFKYVETTPNDFGLTIEEILLAKNKELNQWASLKKAIQIRPDHIEKKEQRLYKLKAKNEDLKRKIFKSIYGEGSDDELDENIKNLKDKHVESQVAESSSNQTESKQIKHKVKRKAKMANTSLNNCTLESTETSETCTALDPKRPRTENTQSDEKTIDGDQTSSINDRPNKMKKKTKRNKNKNQTDSSSQAENGVAESQQVDNKNPFNKSTTTPPEENSNKSETLTTNLFTVNKKLTSGATQTSFKAKLQKKNSNPFKSPKNTSTEKGAPLPPTHKKRTQPNNNKFRNKTTKFNKNKTTMNDSKITDDRLKAYGINPKKFHKKQKFSSNK